jgi:sulfane dehydrogenase subunit SoxC
MVEVDQSGSFGNSASLFRKEPVQANVQAIHGLVSCAEWTGVRLSTLLEETGIDPKAKWFLAEGADGANMNRSIPMTKALDDAMIALYQNGERLAPSNGYPMRLLVPGYEGNMNVKWLHRIKLLESPIMAINETKQYTILRPSIDGDAAAPPRRAMNSRRCIIRSPRRRGRAASAGYRGPASAPSAG